MPSEIYIIFPRFCSHYYLRGRSSSRILAVSTLKQFSCCTTTLLTFLVGGFSHEFDIAVESTLPNEDHTINELKEDKEELQGSEPIRLQVIPYG